MQGWNKVTKCGEKWNNIKEIITFTSGKYILKYGLFGRKTRNL